VLQLKAYSKRMQTDKELTTEIIKSLFGYLAAYHCMYVFRWTYLIEKYNLSANQVDKDKIRDVNGVCDLN